MRQLFVLCTLVLVAPVFAQDKPKEKPGEVIEDAEIPVPAGTLSRKERDAPAAFVRLKRGSVLQVKDGKEWKDASLQELGVFLHSAGWAYHTAQKKKGNTGYQMLPGGVRASKLFMSIEADPGTPWQHIQWLMTIAAEQKFNKLELSDGKRRMLAILPVDLGINPIPQEPPPEIVVKVHVVARAEKEATWGDVKVMCPTKFLYVTGKQKAEDLANVPKRIGAAKKAAEENKSTVVTGEIRAGHKVPFAKVFDVMESFVDHGLPAVNFFGTAIPEPVVRQRTTLPYPTANYAVVR